MDFTGEGLMDYHGHGTHVAGLIAKYAGDSNYCLIIVKYYKEGGSNYQSIDRSLQALQYVSKLPGSYIVNYSGGGIDPNAQEKKAVKRILDWGHNYFVAAAGNHGNDLAKQPYYPASYFPEMIVIGNKYANSTELVSHENSNYGKQVDFWEYGVKVLSTLPNNKVGRMTGTSQATAIHTGKLIKKLNFGRKPF